MHKESNTKLLKLPWSGECHHCQPDLKHIETKWKKYTFYTSPFHLAVASNQITTKITQYPPSRTWYKAPHQRAELHDNKNGATFALHQHLNVPLMADDVTFQSLQCCKSFFVSIPFWSSAGEESHRQLWNAVMPVKKKKIGRNPKTPTTRQWIWGGDFRKKLS